MAMRSLPRASRAGWPTLGLGLGLRRAVPAVARAQPWRCGSTSAGEGEDVLFHLGLSTKEHDLPAMFGDVKFFLTGGSAFRIRQLAAKVEAAGFGTSGSETPIGSTERYEIYKVGPVLLINHGMGIPSTSILLHEVAKLLRHAGADDPVFLRLGTSGGIGVAPGTVVVSTGGVDGLLNPEYTLPILGKAVSRPALLNQELVEEIIGAQGSDMATERGTTMSTDCFYEGQARTDGALCEYTEEDKVEFLQYAHSKGVRNMEMECVQFAAFTHKLGIRAGVCNVTLLDRLLGDQHPHTHEQLVAWSELPGDVAVAYMHSVLGSK